jgi:hypothetical protein
VQRDDRCRPRQPVDHGELADDCAWAENGDDPLLAAPRRHRHLEQPLVKPVAAIGRIPDGEQPLAGFEVAQLRGVKELS